MAPQWVAYAEEVKARLFDEGFFVEVDGSDATLNKKIRNAELSQVNFVLVVGAEEAESKSVNVRCRDDEGERKGKGEVRGLEEVVSKLKVLRESKAKDSRL